MTDPTQRLIEAAKAVLINKRPSGHISACSLVSDARILDLASALAAVDALPVAAVPQAGADYPTPWAYEQACKALHLWRAKADERRAAMAKAQDAGCVDHLDSCDDAGDFWHMALNDPIIPKDGE